MAQNLFQARPILTQKEVIWVIGLILGGIGYGALLTLGVACLVTFSYSRHLGRRWLGCEKILSVHVSLVLLMNTILQVWNAKSNVNAIFYTDPDHITFFYHDWENIFTVFLAMLTEGILVWRCYMIQEALSTEQFSSLWHKTCWIFPAFLWVAGAVTGTAAVVLLDPTAPLFSSAESNSPGLTLFLVAAIVHFTLNLFAISNIIIRLLLHRRFVIAVFGRECAGVEHSLRVSSILLESAAINLPLALLSIVGLLVQANYSALLIQIITPGQCIASILVIYQVARRRTVVESRSSSKIEPVRASEP